MVKFSQDHLKAITSIFDFFAHVELPPPPPLANANLTWAGWLTQHGNFHNFPNGQNFFRVNAECLYGPHTFYA